jgi:hypothetical protein
MRSTIEDGRLKIEFCLLRLLMIGREGASAAEMWLSLTTPRMPGNAQNGACRKAGPQHGFRVRC